jgi:hypothetical protein
VKAKFGPIKDILVKHWRKIRKGDRGIREHSGMRARVRRIQNLLRMTAHSLHDVDLTTWVHHTGRFVMHCQGFVQLLRMLHVTTKWKPQRRVKVRWEPLCNNSGRDLAHKPNVSMFFFLGGDLGKWLPSVSCPLLEIASF